MLFLFYTEESEVGLTRGGGRADLMPRIVGVAVTCRCMHFSRAVPSIRTVHAMAKAFTEACRALGLKPKQDAATRVLALRIIDHARDDIRDPELLKAAALKGFKH